MAIPKHKQREPSNDIMLSAIRWHMPVFVSKGSRMWRLRDWYRIGMGMKDSNDFAWGYRGAGPHAIAYSILYETFGAEIADRYTEKLIDEFIGGWNKDRGFDVRGGDLCEMLNLKTKERKRH